MNQLRVIQESEHLNGWNHRSSKLVLSIQVKQQHMERAWCIWYEVSSILSWNMHPVSICCGLVRWCFCLLITTGVSAWFPHRHTKHRCINLQRASSHLRIIIASSHHHRIIASSHHRIIASSHHRITLHHLVSSYHQASSHLRVTLHHRITLHYPCIIASSHHPIISSNQSCLKRDVKPC